MPLTFSDPRVRLTARRIHALSADLRRIELGLGPTADELASAPVIEDWLLAYRIEPALVGTVIGHPELADGPITTSGIFLLDTELGFARSLSRYYNLGRPRES